jgi:hypothetical protein
MSCPTKSGIQSKQSPIPFTTIACFVGAIGCRGSGPAHGKYEGSPDSYRGCVLILPTILAVRYKCPPGIYSEQPYFCVKACHD